MNSTHKISRAATSALTQTQTRNATRYVTSLTGKPYNTAHLDFKPVHPLVQETRYSEYFGAIATYLKDIQTFKVTPDFKKYANRLLNKDYKESKLLPGATEYDLEASIPSGSFKADDNLIRTIHSQQIIQETENFFNFKPFLNPVAMDLFLELNPEYFNHIKQQRAERILAWATGIAEQTAKSQ